MSDFQDFPGYNPDPLFGPPAPPRTPDYGDYTYEITIYNQFGEPFSNSAEGWYRETTADRDALWAYYHMDNIDLVYEYIQAMQQIDPDFEFDWEQWRADYEAAH